MDRTIRVNDALVTKRSYRNFVIGLLILNLFYFVVYAQTEYNISSIVKYGLIFLVLGTIISYFFKTYKISNNYSKVLKIFLAIFVIRTAFLLVDSFEVSLSFLQKVFVNPLFFLPYLLPIIILFSHFNIHFIKYLLRVSYIVTFFSVSIRFVFLILWDKNESFLLSNGFIGVSSLASGILLMVSHFYSNKWLFRFALLNLILGLIIISMFGSRSGLLSLLFVLVFFFIIRNQSKLIFSAQKLILKLLLVITILTIVISLSFLKKNVYAFERGFNREGYEASRGDVFRAFFNDFSSAKDWIWGRGLAGTILRSEERKTELASTIENGYLSALLKGGLFYLIPMIFIFLIAAYLGYYKTNNDLTKALAATIMIQVLSMFLYGLPETSTGYLLIWICVSACSSVKLRSYTNHEIIKILN